MASPAKKMRVQVDLAPSSYDRLARLKEATEAASYTEVFKNALRLYEYIVETEQQGSELILVREDGSQQPLKIFG